MIYFKVMENINKRKIKFNKEKAKEKNSKKQKIEKEKNTNQSQNNYNLNEYNYSNLDLQNKKRNKSKNKNKKQKEKSKGKSNMQIELNNEDKRRISHLENVIKYTFKNKELGIIAITHKSYAYENNTLYNERLEFLGDSILGFVIAEKLYTSENVDEGKMSKERAYIVCEDSLYEIATKLNIIDILRYGGGQKNKAPKAVLADSVEAIIASIYLDSGRNINIVRKIILNLFGFKIIEAHTKSEISDYKSTFQEIISKRGNEKIEYQEGHETGPDHDKTFEVWLMLGGARFTRGLGKSKKAAEIDAARLGIERLKKEDKI